MSCFSRCCSPSLKHIIEITYPLKIGLPIFFIDTSRFTFFKKTVSWTFGEIRKDGTEPNDIQSFPEIWAGQYWLDIQKHNITLSISLWDLKSLVATADPIQNPTLPKQSHEPPCFWEGSEGP